MNRKKHFLLILFALVLVFTMSFSLFACNRDTGDKNEGVVDDKALVANGTFSGVESETYPKVPTGWTGSAGSVSGSQATPSVQGEDLLTGVINISDKIYKDNAKKWFLDKKNNIGKPSNDSKDNNLLMINNIKKTSYRYTSSSISLEKNSYYKVTVNVKTLDEAEAFIQILGDAHAKFESIKTNNQWKKFEVYIETAVNSSKSITIALSNGWGDKVNGVTSIGAVFFDDIVVEKLEKKDDPTFGKKIYDEKVVQDNSVDNNFATYSMTMPDAEFNYTSGSTQPYSPAKFRGYAGYSKTGNNAPTSSRHTTHGVIDMSNDPNLESIGLTNPTLAPNSLGSNMLFINNMKRTAYGYRSSVPFVIEAGKSYTFTVKVRTDNITGNGAKVRLVESSTDESSEHAIKDINTNGEWKTLTFDIIGNQLSTKEIYFELWLGEGGVVEERNWATGTVYMDCITFGEMKAEAAALAVDDKYYNKADYSDSIDVANNLVDNGYIMIDNSWKEKEFNEKTYNFYNNKEKVYHMVLKNNVDGKKIPLPAENIQITNNGVNPVTLDTVLNIHVGEPGAYGIVIKNGSNNFKIAKNSYYKFSMWVKTDMDKKFDGKGLNINLMQKDGNKKDEENPDKSIASFTNINTRETEVNNGYIQITFYVEGSTTEDNELYLDIMFGSGSHATPESFVKGDAYIALINAEKISHGDYMKANTSTYAKKNSLDTTSSATTSIANGNFTDSDINSTYDNYIKYPGKVDVPEGQTIEDYIASQIIENDEKSPNFGKFVVPTAPTSWTISNKSYLEALTTGIVKDASQFKNVSDSTLKNNLINLIDGADGSALVIASKAKKSGKGYLTVPTSPETCHCTCPSCIEKGICTGDCTPKDGEEHCQCLHQSGAKGMLPVGYSSSSISLEPNKFYMISVRVKAVADAKAYITLSNTNTEDSVLIDSNLNSDWQTVRFFINTGLSSTSVKLELYLGKKGGNEEIKAGAAVAFDTASFEKDITEEYYNSVEANDLTRKIEYITDTFNIDNPSEDGLSAAPSNWSGSAAKDASTKETDLAKGIFDKNYTRHDWLKTTDKDGKDTLIDGSLYDDLLDSSNDNFLVINNITPNAYSFSNSDSKTLAKDAYYKVSVDVLTYGLKESETAYITLKLNAVTYTFDKNADTKVNVNTSTYDKDGKETKGTWRTYTFFVKTPDDTAISNVTIRLGLGKESDNKDNTKENFVQGYAFFDNVTFKKLDADTEFTDAKDSATIKKIAATNDEMAKKEEEKKEEAPVKPKNDLLWVYITSGVIGGLIIIVVIGVVIKKYWSKISKAFTKKKGKNLSEYDKNHPNNTTSSDAKRKEKKSKNEFKD